MRGMREQPGRMAVSYHMPPGPVLLNIATMSKLLVATTLARAISLASWHGTFPATYTSITLRLVPAEQVIGPVVVSELAI